MGSMGVSRHCHRFRDSALAGERCYTPGIPWVSGRLPPPPPMASVGNRCGQVPGARIQRGYTALGQSYPIGK
jgi:hypothetical protein